MKRYIISRQNGVTCNVAREGGGYPLPHIVRHSPTGYEAGYHGSGPSDLALSILSDLIGREAAEADGLYHQFKRDFVAPIILDEGETAQITEERIQEWLESLKENSSEPS
jgi:hypothetical protein